MSTVPPNLVSSANLINVLFTSPPNESSPLLHFIIRSKNVLAIKQYKAAFPHGRRGSYGYSKGPCGEGRAGQERAELVCWCPEAKAFSHLGTLPELGSVYRLIHVYEFSIL